MNSTRFENRFLKKRIFRSFRISQVAKNHIFNFEAPFLFLAWHEHEYTGYEHFIGGR